MNVTQAFDEFQKKVDAPIEVVREARARRSHFKEAFEGDDDVVKVHWSGSLARGTHNAPINDVDVIVEFNSTDHPDWGQPGQSAEDALRHAQRRIGVLLEGPDGSPPNLVRRADVKNHAVKCFLDDPDDEDRFTVDAMPALAHNGHFLIPERHSNTWVEADPKYLIDEVAKRHGKWNDYARSVRILKRWAKGQPFKVKSLVIEVLALNCLPTTEAGRPEAINRFFTAAAEHLRAYGSPQDPAGLCGVIQRDLEVQQLIDALDDAGEQSMLAVAAAKRTDYNRAIALWHNILGDDFPSAGGGGGGGGPKAPIVIPPTAPRPVKDSPQG